MGVKVYELNDKLNKKQTLWIDEYIKCNDYATASRKAGYKGDNLRHIGYMNSLRFKKIIEARTKELNKKITKNTIAELETIQEFWTTVFSDDNEDMKERLKASELLARSKGGFIERREVKEVKSEWFK